MVNKKYPYIQFSSWTVQFCQKIGYRSFFIKTCRRSNNTQVQKHPKRARASLMARLSRDRLEVGHRRLFLFPVLGSIELGDRVGTQFKDSVPDTVALIFARAYGSLHHDVGSLQKCFGVLGESAEDSQLLAKGCIFQCDLFMTAKHENQKPNCVQNYLHHEQMALPSCEEQINRLRPI